VSQDSKMLPRIGLDISALDSSFKAHAGRGTGRYVLELKRYFENNPAADFVVQQFSQHELLCGGVLPRAVDLLPFARQTVRQQLLFPLRAGRFSNCELLHFPAHLDAPSWLPGHFAVTVLDLIPLIFEDLYRPERANWRFTLARKLENRAILSASLILAISEQTKRDVNRILGVPLERIHVTPLGVGQDFLGYVRDPEQELDLRSRYQLPHDRDLILYVGGIDQRKNIRFLLDCFEQALSVLESRGRKLPLLVLAGNIKGDKQFPALEARIKTMRFGSEVALLGFVSDNDLVPLYATASTFFFPSLYEGFGLPPLEAMAVGTPVVCSNVSSLPEVVGEAALTFAPTDLEQAVRSILEIFESGELAKKLSSEGRIRARGFSWDQTGQLTAAAYEQFLRGREQAHVQK